MSPRWAPKSVIDLEKQSFFISWYPPQQVPYGLATNHSWCNRSLAAFRDNFRINGLSAISEIYRRNKNIVFLWHGAPSYPYLLWAGDRGLHPTQFPSMLLLTPIDSEGRFPRAAYCAHPVACGEKSGVPAAFLIPTIFFASTSAFNFNASLTTHPARRVRPGL